MANLKQIRKRIASVESTGKITKAMKMVAVSKLRKSQAAVLAGRPYANELVRVLEHIVYKTDASQHRLLRRPAERRRASLIVVSGDKGLCGAYNHNIIKRARRFVDEKIGGYDSLEVICVGCKAYEALSKISDPRVSLRLVVGGLGRPAEDVALELGRDLCGRFGDGGLDEVFILYTVFRSAISQSVVLDAVLPFASVISNTDADGNILFSEEEKARIDNTCYVYEPSDTEGILGSLLERIFSVYVRRSILEGSASENGARMTAMDSASKNAGEMVGRLRLMYNRARQAAITTELIEVVSGAQAV